MMSPNNFHLLFAFVHDDFIDLQIRAIAVKSECFFQKKRGAQGANSASDLHLFRRVNIHLIVPPGQSNFAMKPSIRAAVYRSMPTPWKHFLPSALVEI